MCIRDRVQVRAEERAKQVVVADGKVAVLAKFNMADGVERGLWLEESLQFASMLEEDGQLDALVLTGGSSLLNGMYFFRGEVPLKEFAAAQGKVVGLGVRAFGSRIFPEYPFEEAFFLPFARQFRAARMFGREMPADVARRGDKGLVAVLLEEHPLQRLGALHPRFRRQRRAAGDIPEDGVGLGVAAAGGEQEDGGEQGAHEGVLIQRARARGYCAAHPVRLATGRGSGLPGWRGRRLVPRAGGAIDSGTADAT